MKKIVLVLALLAGTALADNLRREAHRQNYAATRTEKDAMRGLMQRMTELDAARKSLQDAYRVYVLDKATALGIAEVTTQSLEYDFKEEVFFSTISSVGS